MQRFADFAYLSRFLFSTLPRVAPYFVPGGLRVVSGARGLRAAVSFARSRNWMLGMPKPLAERAGFSPASPSYRPVTSSPVVPIKAVSSRTSKPRLSSSTPTTTLSPGFKEAERTMLASSLSTRRWMVRLKGLAPNSGSNACRAARCSSSSVESEKSCVMSTCSALYSGTTLLRPAPPDALSSKNLLTKSPKRLPPPSGDPPRRERPPPASAACTSHKCSILGSCAEVLYA